MNLIETFLRRCYPNATLHIQPVSGGQNNLAFRVLVDGQPLFLKQYAGAGVNGDNRLLNEYRFLSYLQSISVGSVPQVLEVDLNAGLALYQYVDGESVEAVNEEDVGAAYAFMDKINRYFERDRQKVPFSLASEPALKVRDFVDIVEHRLKHATPVELSGSTSRECLNFVSRQLIPAFETAKDRLFAIKHWDRPCHPCFSPSDFGFHNALRTAEGWVFLDFEYAGIDSTEQLMADFLSQPRVPVPLETASQCFEYKVFQPLLEQRMLFPSLFELAGLKWCLILLNVFWREKRGRKQFALGPDLEALKAQQLLKAMQYLEALKPRVEQLRNGLG